MQKRPAILRFSAFGLLLLFVVKSLGGLFVHNLHHTEGRFTQIPVKQDKGQHIYNANCTCLDEFFQPFAPAEEIIIAPAQPVIPVFAEMISASHAPIFSGAYPTRGPPAFFI